MYREGAEAGDINPKISRIYALSVRCLSRNYVIYPIGLSINTAYGRLFLTPGIDAGVY